VGRAAAAVVHGSSTRRRARPRRRLPRPARGAAAVPRFLRLGRDGAGDRGRGTREVFETARDVPRRVTASVPARDGRSRLLARTARARPPRLRMLYTLCARRRPRAASNGLDARERPTRCGVLGVCRRARSYKRLTARENVAYFAPLTARRGDHRVAHGAARGGARHGGFRRPRTEASRRGSHQDAIRRRWCTIPQRRAHEPTNARLMTRARCGVPARAPCEALLLSRATSCRKWRALRPLVVMRTARRGAGSRSSWRAQTGCASSRTLRAVIDRRRVFA